MQALHTLCIELQQIHNCLRDEVNRLQTLFFAYEKSCTVDSLSILTCHFNFFVVVLKSHSRAEDNVILPAMLKKGLECNASHELETEHAKQDFALKSIETILGIISAKQQDSRGFTRHKIAHGRAGILD